MTNPAVVEQVRKALESVPRKKFTASCVDGCFLGDEMKMEMDEPDYHALTAKVAPLVEALEEVDETLTELKWHTDRGTLMRVQEALAHFWPTEGST